MKKLSKVFASLIATVAIMINLLPISTLLTTIANATSTVLYFNKNTGDFNYTAGDVKTDFGVAYPSNFDKNSTATSKSNMSFAAGTTYTLTLKAVVQGDENRTYGMPSISIGGDSVGTFAGCNITNKDHPTQDPIWGEYYGADASGKFTCVQALTYTPSSSGNKSIVLTFQDDKKDKIGYYSLTIDDGGSGGQTTTYTAAANVATSCTSMGTATVATTDGGTGAASQTIDENGSAYYVATPLAGYKFVKWVATDDTTAAAVSTSASYTATIMSETTLYAVFEKTSTPSTTNTLKIEAENYESDRGYNLQNITVRSDDNYSGGKYTEVTGSDGEPAVEFIAPTSETYTFRIYYFGGSNTYYNFYDTSNFKLRDGKITDRSTLGYYEFTYNVTAGSTYYIGLYGNTGTKVDYFEVIAPTAVFPLPVTNYTANAAVATSCNEMGTATVSATDGGFGTATQTIEENSSAYYVATANEGYRFVKWVAVDDTTATAVSTDSSYTTIIIDDITLYAVFEEIPAAKKYEVTTSVNNSSYGSITATASYNEGTNVTITATPSIGCRVQKWIVDGVDVSSTATTYTIQSITAAHTVQAVFETVPQYTVTAAANNAAYGSVTGSGTVYEGNSVTLTATAASGYEFKGWSTNGGTTIISTTNPLIVSPTSDITYTAVFAAQTHTKTLIIEAENYESDRGYNLQNITVRSDDNYSGGKYTEVTGSDGEPAVEFIAPTSETYTFRIYYFGGSNTYYNFYDTSNFKLRDGKITDRSTLGYYEFTYNVTAGSTYYIGLYGNTGTKVDYFEVIAPTAVFPLPVTNYTANAAVATSCNEMGTATVSATDGGFGTATQTIEENSSAYYVATANEGYRFVKWVAVDDTTATAVSTDSSYTTIIIDDITLYAVFEEIPAAKKYEVTTSVNNSSYGSITATASYDEGTDVIITATPVAGYRVQKWIVDGVDVSSTATTYTIESIAEAHTVQVVFEEIIIREVTAAVDTASGCASMGSATVALTEGGEGSSSQETNENNYVYYVAIANDGYKFVKWVAINDAEAEAVSTNASYAVKVTDDITLYAVFTNLTEYTISTAVNNAEYGSVSDGGIVYENGSITLTATAASGYKFKGWSTDGGATIVSTTNPLTITNPTADVTYTAVFEETSDRTVTAAIVASCLKGGTATVATTSGGTGGSSQSIAIGNSAYFVATAATGYRFVKWVATDDANATAVSTDASYVATISGNLTLYAVFAPDICADSNTKKVFIDNSNVDYNSWSLKDTKYKDSSVTFYNADGTVDFYDNAVELKGRGNYTWQSVQPNGKKPFQLKFSSKIQPLGLGDGKSKTWVFLANVADQSLLRNYAGYYFSDQLSGLSSDEIDGFITDCDTVEVWINGVYYGTYLICEKVETGSARVDVPIPEEATDTEFGFLVERDYYATAEDTGTWFTVDGVNYTIKSDIVFDETAPNAANNAQNTIIKNYIARVNNAIKSQDKATILELIDVNSFVDMYIAQEFVKNCDVGYSSFFMYTNSVTSGKLFLGPVWDFDIALGNNDKFDNGLATGLYAGMSLAEYNAAGGEYKSQANEWFVYLLDTEWFKDLVIARWSELRGQNIVENTIAAVTSQYELHREAFIHNFERWGYPENPTNSEPRYILELDHPGNDNINHVNNLNRWIAERAAYLDTIYYDISAVDEDGKTRYIADLEFEEGTATGNSVIVDGNGNDPATFLVEGARVTGWSSNGYTYIAEGGDGAYVTFTTPTFGENDAGSESFTLTAFTASNWAPGQQINYYIYEGEGTTGTLIASGNALCGFLTAFKGDLVITQTLSSNTTYTFYVEAPANWGHVAFDKLRVVSSTNIVLAIPAEVTAVVVTNDDAEDAAGGLVEGAEGPYYYNDKVTLTATANTGYIFLGWYDAATDGTLLSTEAKYSFTIKEDTTVYARFAEGYVVTTAAYSDKVTTDVMAADANAGTITGEGTYFVGTEVTVKAISAAGYTFVNWTDASGLVLSTNASYTFQMDTYNMDLKANFKYVGAYTLTVESGNGGSVSGTASGTYNKGHHVSLMAVPVGAAVFSKWQIWNGNEYVDYSTERTINFELNSDTIIKAVYDLSLSTSTTYEWEEAYIVGTDTSFYSVDGAYVVNTWTSDNITWSNEDFVYLKTTRISYAVLEVDLRGTSEAADYTFTTYGSSPNANGKSVWVNIYKDRYIEHDGITKEYIGAYTICNSSTETIGTPITITGLEPGIYYFEIVADGAEFCLDKLVVSAATEIIPEHEVKSYEAFTVSGNIMAPNATHSTPYCEILIPQTAEGLDAALNAGLVNYEGAALYDPATWENGVDVTVVYTINGVEYTGTATLSMVLKAGSGKSYVANVSDLSEGETGKLQLSWGENGTVSYVSLELTDLDESLIGETAQITVTKIIHRTQPVTDLSDKSENMIIRGDEVPNASAGSALGYSDTNGESGMAISTVIDPENSFEHRVWKIDYSLDTEHPNEYGVYAGVYRAINNLNVNAEEGKGFSFWYRTPEEDTTGMTLNFCMQSNLYPTGAEGTPMYVYLEPTYGDWKPMYIEYDLVGSYDGATIRYWDIFLNYETDYADGTSQTMTQSEGTFWLSELRIEKEAQVGVTYRNFTGQVIRYQMIAKNSVTTPPEYMVRQEYDFVGWHLDTTATLYELGTEAYTRHFAAGVTENRVYTATYELSGNYYKIDVVNGVITNLNNAGNVTKAKLFYSRYIILTAGEYDVEDPTKTEFQYWTANGEIVSFNASFSTAVMGTTVYEAVFAEAPYAAPKNATNIYDRVTVYDEEHLKTKNTITFNCVFTYDSDNYTVKAFGILVTNEAEIAELSGVEGDIMIILENEAQEIVDASTNTGTLTRPYNSSTKSIQWCKFTSTIYWDSTLATGLYSMKLANLSNGVSRYAVSYLIVEDNVTHKLSICLSSDSGVAYRSGTISSVS